VAVGVLDDDGEVDLAGTPVAVRDDGVSLFCQDCADVHKVAWADMEWVELMGPWTGSSRGKSRGRKRGGRW
jgi:hypothetical protein